MNQNFFSLPDGRRLSWFEAGEGAPLVLLHGWSISAAAFTELAQMLCSDYRLLIPDLPGHGESSPAVENNFAELARDITTWLDAVTQGPVTLVGWSLGGMLTMEIASNASVPLKQLVLVGTTPRFTNSADWGFGLPKVQVHALYRQLKTRFETTLGEFFRLTLAGESLPVERLRAIQRFAVKNRPLPDKDVALALLQLLAYQDQRGLLEKINCPVIVVHGTEDQISPLAAGRFIADSVANGVVVEFPGVGHAPFWSAPKLFADVLREYC